MAFQIIWSEHARDDLQAIVLFAQDIGIARIWHGARGEPEIPAQLNF